MSIQPYLDTIGYLPWEKPIEFGVGSISPLDDYQEVTDWINKYKHNDGFLYPSIQHTVNIPISYMKGEFFNDSDLEEVPNSERPAHLHKIPASHRISLNTTKPQELLRESDAAFLMHLAAYLFGVRLQFNDWWFDGRVPIKSTHNIHLTPSKANAFFLAAYGNWKSFKTKYQKLMINLLYMNSRTLSYEWDWEQFTIAYMVFDGCYKFAKNIHSLNSKSHTERLNVMCNFFGIKTDKVRFSEIVRLRNSLFHETLWDDGQPCSTKSSKPQFVASNLRKLNQRVIAALLGHESEYISSNWWSLGVCSF